jgi:hypothetical protein
MAVGFGVVVECGVAMARGGLFVRILCSEFEKLPISDEDAFIHFADSGSVFPLISARCHKYPRDLNNLFMRNCPTNRRPPQLAFSINHGRR